MNWFLEHEELRHLLQSTPISTSAPCRVDMGGTLDIRSFYLPLGYLAPCTTNVALDLRTHVTLKPFKAGQIKVSSKGFDSAVFPLDTVPFNHPLGLMFAVTAFFRAQGVHVLIESHSPPRSALGGSSVAAVALVAALDAAGTRLGHGAGLNAAQIAMLAHRIEESVAGVPCGSQDQLAAAMGGVNAWYWKDGRDGTDFERKTLMPVDALDDFGAHLLVAYCGIPHVSKDVNARWVQQFIGGETRHEWIEITRLARGFAQAVEKMDLPGAIAAMNREMTIRSAMTPDVLDDMGSRLAAAANRYGCGARISGAGAGGCIWALGELDDIKRLRPEWLSILATRRDARLLDTGIDKRGVAIETQHL